MENAETKLQPKSLQRISEKKYRTYEEAKAAYEVRPEGTAKAKIFARYDGTFDLVFYKKIQPEVKVVDVIIATDGNVISTAKVHGLKSKDRKKPR